MYYARAAHAFSAEIKCKRWWLWAKYLIAVPFLRNYSYLLNQYAIPTHVLKHVFIPDGVRTFLHDTESQWFWTWALGQTTQKSGVGESELREVTRIWCIASAIQAVTLNANRLSINADWRLPHQTGTSVKNTLLISADLKKYKFFGRMWNKDKNSFFYFF